MRTLMIVQGLLIAAVCLLPVGFDKPSTWGLDFGHLLIGLSVYGAVLVAGLVLAALKRRWLGFWLQLGGAGFLAAAVFLRG